MMTYLFIAVCSYLLGTIPTALFVVRVLTGLDVRSGESGNMGAMNTLRMVGKTRGKAAGVAAGLFVWIADGAKAAAAVALAQHFLPGSVPAITIATAAAICGHNYPIWLKGKGGRGAASFMGILMYFGAPVFFAWLLTVAAGSAIAEAAVSIYRGKQVSVKTAIHGISDQIAGRLLSEIIAVFVVWRVEPSLLWPTAVATVLIVYRHKERLERQFGKPKK